MKQFYKFDDEEKIVESIQDHWIILAKYFSAYAVGWVIALFFYEIAVLINDSSPVLAQIILFVSFITVMAINHWLFIYLLYWELSTWVITTKRLIDFRFLPYVQHDTSFIVISEIHEIDKWKHGILKNLFNYGDVEINLPAIPKPHMFHYVPKPSRFATMIHTIHKTKHPNRLDIAQVRAIFRG
jgi:hypothetical protein